MRRHKLKKTILLFVGGIVLSALTGCDILNHEDSQNIVIQGSLIGWNGGDNKTLVFGKFDETSNQLIYYGSTQISANGSFQFDSLSTPPLDLLEPVEDGPESEQNCEGNIEINNKNALVGGDGKFYILENGQVIGNVFTGEIEMEGHYPPVNQSYVEYIYSQETVTIKGMRNCTTDFGKTEIVNADISLNAGWNTVVVETIAETETEIELSYKSNENTLINWQFNLDDLTDNVIDGDYDFNIEGKIESWNLGNGKVLQFGSFNYITNEFEIYAESQITADGQFKFDKAKNPSLNFLYPLSEGIGQPKECTPALEVDNQNSIGAKGTLLIFDPVKNERVGEVTYGFDNFNDGIFEVGEFEAVFIFASSKVSVGGSVQCSNDFHQVYTNENISINFTANKGWNRLYRKIINLEGTTIYGEVSNNDAAGGYWYVHNRNDGPQDFEGTYPIDISGKIENWDLGTGKYVKFGEFNFDTGAFEVLADSEISADGSFSITSAVNPSRNFLFQAKDGFVNINECSTDVTVSNSNVFGSYGHLVIFDSQTQQIIGNLHNSLDVSQDGMPDVGDFNLEYYFVTDDILITGTAACEHEDQFNNIIHEEFEFDMNLKKGWNIGTRKIKSIFTNSVSFEITTGNTQTGKWYYNKSD